MGFKDDLQNFRNKTVAKQDALVREVVGQVALSLITKSPVGDPALWKTKYPPKNYKGGQFRGNWRLGVDAIDGTTNPNDIDPDGGATLDNIVGKIPANAMGHIYYITNGLPYAQRLEDGWSSQAPSGMVALTQIEFYSIVSNAVKIVSLGGGGFGL